MAPKDYVILRLTGEAAADPIASVGLVDGGLRYLAPLLDLVPGAAERLAPLHKFTHRVGKVSAGLPCAGTPVVVGAMDAWGGMFGVGVASARQRHVSQRHQRDHGHRLAAAACRRRASSPSRPMTASRCMPAPTQSGGASMMWLGGLLGKDLAELSELAATLDPGERVPLFLPHLQGERAPIWDAFMRAACSSG